jgi:hypothetical protein
LAKDQRRVKVTAKQIPHRDAKGMDYIFVLRMPGPVPEHYQGWYDLPAEVWASGIAIAPEHLVLERLEEWVRKGYKVGE